MLIKIRRYNVMYVDRELMRVDAQILCYVAMEEAETVRKQVEDE